MSDRYRSADISHLADDRASSAKASVAADRTPTADRTSTADRGITADRDQTSARHETLDQNRPTKPGSPDSSEPKYGVNGSWDWKGLHLTPEQCRIADNALGRCRAAEGRSVFGGYGEAGLTPAMRRIEAELEHGKLVPETEKFALKSPDRFKEKLARLIADEPGVPPAVLVGRIHDGVRYTFLIDEFSYARGVSAARASLEANGYELQTLRNAWGQEQYKGINSRWHDPRNGLLFEVQFHTHESWEAKQATHDAYERIASPATPISEKVRLRAHQREVSGSVPIPPQAVEIPEYRKDG